MRCTINKSAHTKKSLETYLMILVYIYIYIYIRKKMEMNPDNIEKTWIKKVIQIEE